MKTKAKNGQTLADIAIQEFGSWTAIIGLAAINGMALTDLPDNGKELKLQNQVYNQTMADYCRREMVRPATARSVESYVGIFSEQFTEQFM